MALDVFRQKASEQQHGALVDRSRSRRHDQLAVDELVTRPGARPVLHRAHLGGGPTASVGGHDHSLLGGAEAAQGSTVHYWRGPYASMHPMADERSRTNAPG